MALSRRPEAAGTQALQVETDFPQPRRSNYKVREHFDGQGAGDPGLRHALEAEENAVNVRRSREAAITVGRLTLDEGDCAKWVPGRQLPPDVLRKDAEKAARA